MFFSYLNNKFKQTKHYCHRFGLKKSLIKVVRSAYSKIHRQIACIVLVKDLLEETNCPIDYKLKLQKIEKIHLDALIEFNSRYDWGTGRISNAKINDYFEKNYEGFIAFFEGKIVGYLWWVDNSTKARKSYPHLTLFGIELKDNDAYGFHYFLAPEFRGKHNATEFMCKVFFDLKDLGYKRFFGIAYTDNISARWLYRFLGFKDVKKIMDHRLFYFVLVVNKTIFIKTRRQYMYYPFHYRVVFPFRNIKILNR
ncbi:GNAT family N-acetyltransferase [Candidatus Omnitrophota bacterium]